MSIVNSVYMYTFKAFYLLYKKIYTVSKIDTFDKLINFKGQLYIFIINLYNWPEVYESWEEVLIGKAFLFIYSLFIPCTRQKQRNGHSQIKTFDYSFVLQQPVMYQVITVRSPRQIAQVIHALRVAPYADLLALLDIH